jgi:hypothetical protein
MVPKNKKHSNIKTVGKLVQVAGWMSPDDKKRLTDALARHSFIGGQSDFINKVAEALVSQSKPGKSPIAQPLCFLTVEQRDMLAAHKMSAKKNTKGHS